jgi:hypothetical protein
MRFGNKEFQKIYYGHSRRIYGTPEEELVRNILSSRFKEVVCPNRDLADDEELIYFFNVLIKCDALITTEFLSHIGFGMFKLTEFALEAALPAYCLRFHDGQPILSAIEGLKPVVTGDYAVFYGKILTNSESISV